MSKKVFVCRFHQESNSFNPVLTGIDSFNVVDTPEDVLTTNGKCGITLNGIYKTLSEKGYEVVSGICMECGSSAPLKNEVVNFFIDKTIPRTTLENPAQPIRASITTIKENR